MSSPTPTTDSTSSNPYLTPTDVEREFGFTRAHLAQMRFQGDGPRYRKPTPRKVLYTRADIIEWIEASARSSTVERTA